MDSQVGCKWHLAPNLNAEDGIPAILYATKIKVVDAKSRKACRPSSFILVPPPAWRPIITNNISIHLFLSVRTPKTYQRNSTVPNLSMLLLHDRSEGAWQIADEHTISAGG